VFPPCLSHIRRYILSNKKLFFLSIAKKPRTKPGIYKELQCFTNFSTKQTSKQLALQELLHLFTVHNSPVNLLLVHAKLTEQSFSIPCVFTHNKQVKSLTSNISQNHRMVGVGRDLCGSSRPTPLPKQGHLLHAAQDLVQVGL